MQRISNEQTLPIQPSFTNQKWCSQETNWLKNSVFKNLFKFEIANNDVKTLISDKIITFIKK